MQCLCEILVLRLIELLVAELLGPKTVNLAGMVDLNMHTCLYACMCVTRKVKARLGPCLPPRVPERFKHDTNSVPKNSGMCTLHKRGSQLAITPRLLRDIGGVTHRDRTRKHWIWLFMSIRLPATPSSCKSSSVSWEGHECSGLNNYRYSGSVFQR